MKLPRFTLRELFLLVVIAAMGCSRPLPVDSHLGFWERIDGEPKLNVLLFNESGTMAEKSTSRDYWTEFRYEISGSRPPLKLVLSSDTIRREMMISFPAEGQMRLSPGSETEGTEGVDIITYRRPSEPEKWERDLKEYVQKLESARSTSP